VAVWRLRRLLPLVVTLASFPGLLPDGHVAPNRRAGSGLDAGYPLSTTWSTSGGWRAARRSITP
jgi:hypothetical protein